MKDLALELVKSCKEKDPTSWIPKVEGYKQVEGRKEVGVWIYGAKGFKTGPILLDGEGA